MQGGGVCVPAPPARCSPSEGGRCGPALAVEGGGTSPSPPSAASWAASTTTVTGLGWRVRPGWGLCIPDLVSLRPQPGLGGHGSLPHGGRSGLRAGDDLSPPPTLLEEHRSLPSPQPLERTELARGAHRARPTVSVAGGRMCPPPHAPELSCAQISLGTRNALEDVVMLDAGPVALVPQGGGVCEAGRFRRALPLTGRDTNCRGPWQAGWSCC